jgi:hypothetical protein
MRFSDRLRSGRWVARILDRFGVDHTAVATVIAPELAEPARTIADLTRAHLEALARCAELATRPAVVQHSVFIDPADLASAIIERVQIDGAWDGTIPPGEYGVRPA